jgi:hypothetical protein
MESLLERNPAGLNRRGSKEDSPTREECDSNCWLEMEASMDEALFR